MRKAMVPVVAVLLVFGSRAYGGAMPLIGPHADGAGFVCAGSGAAFVPWGFNYDHDRSCRLLEAYWHHQWPTVVEDFQEMKALGANVVRVHPQFGRFMSGRGRPNTAALARLTDLLALAERAGLYLDITGLGCYHKKDVPAWYDALTERDRWDEQARFWGAVADVCAASPAVFCYDLMNEPVLPGADGKETQWLLGEFGGKYFVQRISLDLAGRTRQQVAKAWVDHLVRAIRKHDHRHLITVGVIPWVQVFPKAKPLFYSRDVAAGLDFVSVHFYPVSGQIDEALTALKAYEIGRPIVVEEMFPLKCSSRELREFILASRQTADGWMSFYWGKTISEYEDETSIGSAITKEWLATFQTTTEEVLSVDRRGR